MSAPAAIVTGGTRGIGLGISQAFLEAGWGVAAVGRRPVDALDEEAARQVAHDRVRYIQADIANAADRQRIVDDAWSAFGSVSALVNNAGISSPDRGDPLDARLEDLQAVLDVNLVGTFALTQAVARRMVDDSRPETRRSITTLTSISAEVVSPDRADYCMSKAALSMAVKVWAARLAEYDIDCFEVRPGLVRTDMTAPAHDKYDRLIAQGLTLEPRWGTPDDIGTLVLSLANGSVPYSTGQVFTIDGGLTLPRL